MEQKKPAEVKGTVLHAGINKLTVLQETPLI